MLKNEAKNKRITKSIYPIYVCSCIVIIAYLVSIKKRRVKNEGKKLLNCDRLLLKKKNFFFLILV